MKVRFFRPLLAFSFFFFFFHATDSFYGPGVGDPPLSPPSRVRAVKSPISLLCAFSPPTLHLIGGSVLFYCRFWLLSFLSFAGGEALTPFWSSFLSLSSGFAVFDFAFVFGFSARFSSQPFFPFDL